MAEISLPIKVAFALIGVGLLLHLIGFSAPYWQVSEWYAMGRYTYFHMGLWRWCTYVDRSVGICGSLTTSSHNEDALRATQFFETVGLIAIVVSLTLLLIGYCVVTCRDRRILPILGAVFSLIAAGCVLLGCIIYGSKFYDLSWAFALSIVGGIFYAVAGIVILVVIIAKKH